MSHTKETRIQDLLKEKKLELKNKRTFQEYGCSAKEWEEYMLVNDLYIKESKKINGLCEDIREQITNLKLKEQALHDSLKKNWGPVHEYNKIRRTIVTKVKEEAMIDWFNYTDQEQRERGPSFDVYLQRRLDVETKILQKKEFKNEEFRTFIRNQIFEIKSVRDTSNDALIKKYISNLDLKNKESFFQDRPNQQAVGSNNRVTTKEEVNKPTESNDSE